MQRRLVEVLEQAEVKAGNPDEHAEKNLTKYTVQKHVSVSYKNINRIP